MKGGVIGRKISSILVFFLFFVVIILSSQITVASDWNMFHHDLKHTGFSSDTGPVTNNVLWIYPTDGFVYSSPSIVDDKMYIGSDDGQLYCLNALTGNKIWNASLSYIPWFSSPAIAQDRVYIGGSALHCFNAEDGDLIWMYPGGLHVSSSPAVVGDRVYVSTWGGVFCFDADPDDNGDGVINHNPYDEIEDDDDEGAIHPLMEFDIIWIYETDSLVVSSPAIDEDKVYVGTRGGKLHCLDADGNDEGITEVLWNFTVSGYIDSSPVVYGNKVYFGADNKKVYCLDADTGEELWDYSTQGAIKSSPAVADGKIFVGSYDKKMYCLNAETGEPCWNNPFMTGGLVSSSPAVADGKVYFGSHDTKIYCVDALDGSLIWEYETNGRIEYSSPAISNGRMYVGSYDKSVYCFEDLPDSNQAPLPPSQPVGPDEGEVSTLYNFATTTSDPDGDSLYYWFDWGDTTNTGWIDVSVASHMWADEGIYNIRVKARDVYEAESTWSEPLTITITQIMVGQEQRTSWFYGTVVDSSLKPITGVSICAEEHDESGSKKYCTSSKSDGTYILSVPAGSYILTVSKSGFEQQTSSEKTVGSYEAMLADFMLQDLVDDNDSELQEETGLAQYVVETQKAAGKVGLELDATTGEHQVTIYSELEIEVTEAVPLTQGSVSFTITGEHIGGTFLVIYVNTVDPDRVVLSYDQQQISRTSDIISFFSTENTEESWVLFPTDHKDIYIIFLYVPSFSMHTVTISSVAEAFTGVTGMILFLSVILVATLVFIGPVYHYYFKKSKE